MPTRSVDLSDTEDQFVTRQLASGKYANASEVLIAGLRLLEQQLLTDEEKLVNLRRMAEVGFNQLDQNLAMTIEDEADLRELVARLGETAAEQTSSQSGH